MMACTEGEDELETSGPVDGFPFIPLNKGEPCCSSGTRQNFQRFRQSPGPTRLRNTEVGAARINGTATGKDQYKNMSSSQKAKAAQDPAINVPGA